MQSDEFVEQFERNRKRAEYRMNFANRRVGQRDAMRLRRGGSIGSVERRGRPARHARDEMNVLERARIRMRSSVRPAAN
jgi:hypothetical protein